jgi:hypothetical protein
LKKTLSANDILFGSWDGEQFSLVSASGGLTAFGLTGGKSGDAFVAAYSIDLANNSLGNKPEDLFPMAAWFSGGLVDLDTRNGAVVVVVNGGSGFTVDTYDAYSPGGAPQGGSLIELAQMASNPCFDGTLEPPWAIDLADDDAGYGGLIVGIGGVEQGALDMQFANAIEYKVGQAWSDPEDPVVRTGVFVTAQSTPEGHDAYALVDVIDPEGGKGPVAKIERWNLEGLTQLPMQEVSFAGVAHDIHGWTDTSTYQTYIGVAALDFGLHIYEYAPYQGPGQLLPVPIEHPVLLSAGSYAVGGISAAGGWLHVAMGEGGLVSVDGEDWFAPDKKPPSLTASSVLDVHVLPDVNVQPDGQLLSTQDVAFVAHDGFLSAYGLQDPSVPVKLWNLNDVAAQRITVDLPYLYVTTPTGLTIVSVNGDNLAEQGAVVTTLALVGIEDVVVSAGRMFLLSSGQIYSFDLGGWGDADASPSNPSQVGGTLSVSGDGKAVDMDVLLATDDSQPDRLVIAAGVGGLYRGNITAVGPPSNLTQAYKLEGADDVTHVIVEDASVYIASLQDIDYTVSQLRAADGQLEWQWTHPVMGTLAEMTVDGGVLHTITEIGDIGALEVSCL